MRMPAMKMIKKNGAGGTGAIFPMPVTIHAATSQEQNQRKYSRSLSISSHALKDEYGLSPWL